MQRVIAIILRQRVRLAVQREFSVRDSVPVSSNQCAKKSFVGEVAIEAVIAEHHIVELAGAIGDLERNDDPAEVGDRNFHALLIGQGIKIHRSPVAGFSK